MKKYCKACLYNFLAECGAPLRGSLRDRPSFLRLKCLSPISPSGISGVGFAVNIYLLLYSLPIAATLEAVLLAGLTYRGWIPRNLGIAAICVFFAISAIVIFSPIFVPVFGMSFLIIYPAFPVQLRHA